MIYRIAERIRHSTRYHFSGITYKIGVAAIAFGIAAMLIGWMVMLGFQEAITTNLTNFSGDFQVTRDTPAPSFEEQGMHKKQLQDLQGKLSTIIEGIYPFAYKTVLVRTPEGVTGMVCKGVDLHNGTIQLAKYLQKGRLLQPYQIGVRASHEVMVSDHAARRLRLKVGDPLIVHTIGASPRYRKLRVVGVYNTNMAQLEEKLIFCDLKLIQGLKNWDTDRVDGYALFVKQRCHLNKAMDTIIDHLGNGLRLQCTSKTYTAFYNWLTILRKNTFIFNFFILLVASFIIMSIVIIQVMERSHMMAILRVVGATNKQIYGLLLYNSLHLLVRGILIGNFVGIGIGSTQYYFQWMSLNPQFYYVDHIPIYWSWDIFLGVNLFTFLLTTIVLFITISFTSKKPIVPVLVG